MRDKMNRYIFDETANDSACRQIQHFVQEQEMDTDAVNADVAILQEEGDSNLYKALQPRLGAIKPMTTFVRRHRVCSKSYGTGIKFNYWGLKTDGRFS